MRHSTRILLFILVFPLSLPSCGGGGGGGLAVPVTSAPSGVSATARDANSLISWTAASGAISYNVYWSTTAGVNKTNGTKINLANNPQTHTGLTNGTPYY